MGNTTTSSEQLPAAFKNLNEDNMVVLLQYLDVPDFVHLTQTSKKLLNETLGPNNYLWAQLLNRPTHPPQMTYPMHFYPPSPSSTTRLANQVLQTTRNGRKLAVDGTPLDLTVPFDTVNKHLVSHFDFRQEIKWFYLMSQCTSSLASKIVPIVLNTTALMSPNIRVLSDIKPGDYDTTSPPLQGTLTDVTFVVELGVNAASLETLRQQKLPSLHKSRPVVYTKSNNYAGWAYISRSRAMPHPQLLPQYLPGTAVAGFPYPVPQPPYPGPVMNTPYGTQPVMPFVPQSNNPNVFNPGQPSPYGNVPPMTSSKPSVGPPSQPRPPQPLLPSLPRPSLPPQPLLPAQPVFVPQVQQVNQLQPQQQQYVPQPQQQQQMQFPQQQATK